MLKTINTINVRYNRFKKNTRFENIPFNKFDFESGLISVDLPKHSFINKASSEKEEIYDCVVDMYLSYLENDFSFINGFQGDEILLDFKAERLLDIIKEVQHQKYKIKDLETIIKFNNINYPQLHFFIKKSRNNLKVLLIDLYHMGIYGDLIEDGKAKKITMQKLYKKYKNNEYYLDDIKKIRDNCKE